MKNKEEKNTSGAFAVANEAEFVWREAYLIFPYANVEGRVIKRIPRQKNFTANICEICVRSFSYFLYIRTMERAGFFTQKSYPFNLPSFVGQVT